MTRYMHDLRASYSVVRLLKSFCEFMLLRDCVRYMHLAEVMVTDHDQVMMHFGGFKFGSPR